MFDFEFIIDEQLLKLGLVARNRENIPEITDLQNKLWLKYRLGSEFLYKNFSYQKIMLYGQDRYFSEVNSDIKQILVSLNNNEIYIISYILKQ